VTDALDKASVKTAEAAKVGASKTKSFGTHTVNVTDNVAGQAYEGGRWFMVTTWDGAKWVSKRTWFPDKKH
jgi:cytochrome c biogenesis protein ResB